MDVEQVANFLRCGCSAVQLTSNSRAFDKHAEKLKQCLAMLAIGAEKFLVEKHAVNDATCFYVLIVKRVVHP